MQVFLVTKEIELIQSDELAGKALRQALAWVAQRLTISTSPIERYHARQRLLHHTG